jgi:hypothetical protein
MAEKKVIELEVKENLGNLKQQLKQAQVEVQNLADKFGATSDQAREAAKRAAELKDRIGDAKTLTDSFNPDAKFKGLSQVLTGVTGGFAAVQGAMGLIGVESENVEKQLLKVQSAMALASGIDQLSEAKDAVINFGKAAVNSFKALKAAIGSTGIGLIIISLGVIYTYWEDISKAIGFAGDETEKYAKQQKAIGEEAKKQSEEVAKESGAFATLISRLKATNQNSKEREELIKKINLQYGTTLKNIKDERDFQAQLNTELASYLEYQKAKYYLQKNEDLIVKNLQKQDELKAKILKTEKELKAAAIEILEFQQAGSGILESQSNIPKLKEKLKDLREEYGKAKDRFVDYGEAAQKAAIKVDILTKAGTKYVEQVKKDEPETTKVVKKEKEEQLHLTRKHSSTVITDIVSEGTKRLEAEKLIGLKSREQLKKDLQDQKDLRERNLQFIIQSMTQILTMTQDLASMSENKYKEINDKVLANENLTTEQKQKAIIKNNANAKKAFEFNKKLQIASTLISTFATAREAYGSQFKPEADISSPIRGAVAAGIATVGGLIAIKKIASTQFQGTAVPSGGDGGGATVPTMSAPQFNVVGQSGVNQLASLGQQPIQAYVVSGQVTSQQALDRNRLANATLGG